MHRRTLFTLFLLGPLLLFAQNKVQLTIEEAKQRFVEHSPTLLAEQQNIDISKTKIQQAKALENPNFSLEQLNLWSTSSQRGHQDELIPPIVGRLGKNRQFSLSLTQPIRTGGKRGKEIAIARIENKIAIEDFSKVQRLLTKEFAQQIYELIYGERLINLTKEQIQILSKIASKYRELYQRGYETQAFYLRFQSELDLLNHELIELESDYNKLARGVKRELHLPSSDELVFIQEPSGELPLLSAEELVKQSQQYRPEINTSKLYQEQLLKELSLEKAQRIPNMEISASYDRFGGVWKDFIGFGVSFDLPIFNRNKGGIKQQQLLALQQEAHQQILQNSIKDEVLSIYHSYLNWRDFNKKLDQENPLNQHSELLQKYADNLLNKNISILEFFDFINSYKEHMHTRFTALKQQDILYEELCYAACLTNSTIR